MASRTCKPDADFKRLWRTLFPGTEFPSCGSVDVADGGSVDAQKNSSDEPAPVPSDAPAHR